MHDTYDPLSVWSTIQWDLFYIHLYEELSARSKSFLEHMIPYAMWKNTNITYWIFSELCIYN